MSDVHLFLRYGLTGVALIVFVIAGLGLHEQLPAVPDKDVVGAEVITLGLLPLIGIAVQGAYIIWLALTGRFFQDDARELVHEAVFNALIADPAMTPEQRCKQRKALFADSSFVWLYYSDAPPHLIDWARRRRSYHYLGVELAIAAVAGLTLGILLPPVRDPHHVRWASGFVVAAVAVATAIWTASALYLAALMQRNVDEMELTWARARLSEGFWRTRT